MEKPKKSQIILILSVLALTLYNILPTVLYYAQPLKSAVSVAKAEAVAQEIVERVNQLRGDSKEWVSSYCDLLGLTPKEVLLKDQNIHVEFAKSEDAAIFRKHFPKAGNLIPFIPAQMGLAAHDETGKTVIVQRRITTELGREQFTVAKKDSPLYRDLIIDRAAAIAFALTGPTEQAMLIGSKDPKALEALFLQIQFIKNLAETDLPAAKRYAAAFTQGPFTDRAKVIQSLITNLEAAKLDASYVKKNTLLFTAGMNPNQLPDLEKHFREKDTLSLGGRSPLVSDVSIDWKNEKITLKLHPAADRHEKALINEIAKLSRFTGETVGENRTIAFHDLEGATSLLVLNLEDLAAKEALRLETLLKTSWRPTHPDLLGMTIVRESNYEKLSAEEKALSLVVKPDLRIVTHGILRIAKNYEKAQHSDAALLFNHDFKALAELLAQNGCAAYRNSAGDFVFEKRDLFDSLLGATRETFVLKGSHKYAVLELSNLEQRLLVENRIANKMHEELLKWQDDYKAAQVSLQEGARFGVPQPTKNIFLENTRLTLAKIWHGDEKKVIRWGLDLSGGKSVQIELRDNHNRVVTDEAALKQGINELYSRVNKMGVSEVAIRQLGNHIVLDFPGSQALSASELIQASSMSFHIVNEKFSSTAAQRFLSEVWNEAFVTGKKTPHEIEQIAIKRLHMDAPNEITRELLNAGLVLGDTGCKVVPARNGEGLLIVFSEAALEGADLENIQTHYDPQKGNMLSFSVAKKAQEKLYSWTSRYSKEALSEGHGWRMAVVLNETVISAPTLESGLKDSASISGHFSQREVTALANDLKAGSLTFTPKILSEKNVSPELGTKDRTQGILSTIVALCLVIVSMVVYYRFAGFIASVAVFMNLLILWATLQNMDATLSLAGIAGIILTVGMAVDANVLVFERIKEEFAETGRIASAIQAGYKKAYSAIIDSNVTTIIAALILLNFDAGPIKGFALTLIIGIASSMFTALFMTRVYFSQWLQNPKNTALHMADWFKAKSIDFLKWTRPAFVVTVALIAVGFGLGALKSKTLFGMDFTGGYSLHMEGDQSQVEKALHTAGIHDFHIRTLDTPTSLRILFSKTAIPAENQLTYLSDALQVKNLEANWTAVSGQMSESMRNNALLGLLLAFVCIFAYIAIRFEYTFAAAATLCLIHDVLITLAVMGLLHFFGVPVQIDLNTVAAIMTIVGYSLNDTIIVFDRIREEMAESSNKSLPAIVNSALNHTLSRTSITSGTTLLVLLALVILGGSSIFSFALVMTIGVVFGTLSSWFIASPLMLFFHKRERVKASA